MLGWVCDIYGRRKVLLVSTSIVMVTGLLCILAPSFVLILTCRFVIGESAYTLFYKNQQISAEARCSYIFAGGPPNFLTFTIIYFVMFSRKNWVDFIFC